MQNVTPETNLARLLAEPLSRVMARSGDVEEPEVVEEPPATARFWIETPFGRALVSVTMEGGDDGD